MSSHLIVVENIKDWKPDFPDMEVITAKEYLSRPELYKHRGTRLINLCRTYRYLSTGYYCSLLGEARRHRLLPSVHTITTLSSKSIYSLDTEEISNNIERAVKRLKLNPEQQKFELNVFFGKSDITELAELGRQLFDTLPAPLLRLEFKHHRHWQISSIKSVSLNSLKSEQQDFFINSLSSYLGGRWRSPKTRKPARYELAILHNPEEKLPPSDKLALKKFISAGKKMGVDVDLITQKDYNKLAEYDALFIRETTAINHYTYRFAKKAVAEGMVVIDDPESIVKCCNKVYLTELLSINNIPSPRTAILRKGDPGNVEQKVGYPAVLKIPDGSFSRGMYKSSSDTETQQYSTELFKESDLILAQEYMYTDFDWRIGILNNEILYACKYFMSPEHWQIVQHTDTGESREGGFECLALNEVPDNVIDVALKAAKLIGNGLYGVDLKEKNGELYVIEVNDNPNIDSGVEDLVMGTSLYSQIINEFIRRIEQRLGNR